MLPLILIVVALLVSGGSYVVGRHDGRSLAEGDAQREERIAASAAQIAADTSAKAISSMKVRHVTIKQQLEREVREVPVYRDCQHTPDGLQRVNDALTGAAASAPSGRGLVPAPDALK